MSYDKEDYKKKQAEQKEELNQRIIQMAENYESNPELIAEYLAFQAKFYQYSPRNTMLLLSQNPHITFVASYEDWKKKGYSVLRGQTGLKMLVPVELSYFIDTNGKAVRVNNATNEQKKSIKEGSLKVAKKLTYKIGSTFDISQTTCPPEDYPKIFSHGYESINHNVLYCAISKYSAAELGFEVIQKDFNSIALRGKCIHNPKQILINHRLRDTQALDTLIHELGHAILHNNYFRVNADTGEKKTTAQIELEADCVAIMVSEHLGLNVTDSRIQHLASHYKIYQEERKAIDETSIPASSFEKIITNVTKEFKEHWETIQEYIEKERSLFPKPKFNVLQLSNDSDITRNIRFRGLKELQEMHPEGFDCSNYELVYNTYIGREKYAEITQDFLQESEKYFINLNSPPRPDDFYGASPSVSDVFVYTEDGTDFKCFFVDHYNFVPLGSNFLTQDMKTKINQSLTIKEEYEQLTEKEATSSLTQEEQGRLDYLNKNYRYLSEVQEEVAEIDYFPEDSMTEQELLEKLELDFSLEPAVHISYFVGNLNTSSLDLDKDVISEKLCSQLTENISSLEEAVNIYQTQYKDSTQPCIGFTLSFSPNNTEEKTSYRIFENNELDLVSYHQNEFLHDNAGDVVQEIRKKLPKLLNTADFSVKEASQPFVQIIWSENPNEKLKNGNVMSLQEAEYLFRTIDDDIRSRNLEYEYMTFDEKQAWLNSPNNRIGYDKTKFVIVNDNYVYCGRYDLGDGDGGLIEHIRNFWESEYSLDLKGKRISKQEYEEKTKELRLYVKELWNGLDMQCCNNFLNQAESILDNERAAGQSAVTPASEKQVNLLQDSAKKLLNRIDARNRFFDTHGYAEEFVPEETKNPIQASIANNKTRHPSPEPELA